MQRRDGCHSWRTNTRFRHLWVLQTVISIIKLWMWYCEALAYQWCSPLIFGLGLQTPLGLRYKSWSLVLVLSKFTGLVLALVKKWSLPGCFSVTLCHCVVFQDYVVSQTVAYAVRRQPRLATFLHCVQNMHRPTSHISSTHEECVWLRHGRTD